MSLGCVMMFSAALAILRFDDIYMRLHASGKAATGGTLALLGGILIITGLDEVSGKIILVMIFIFFTSPIISHAIARAAHIKSGIGAEIPFADMETHKRKLNKNGKKQEGDRNGD